MSCRYELGSVVAPYIGGLLAEKRALGFLYRTEGPMLARFDGYCLEHGLEQPEITRDFLAVRLEQSGAEGSRNHCKRVGAVRQLMLHMASRGLRVHIPGGLPKIEVTLPHIMAVDERAALFAEVDAYRPATDAPACRRRAGEYRVLFRMIYCCGLRSSEACALPNDRVDTGAGTLTITESKGRKDRIVYVASDLAGLVADYLAWLQKVLAFRPDWFFPAKDPGRPLANTSVDRVFNRCWGATRFAESCNDEPVVHDLRFSFITDRVNRWALAGEDVEAMMPYPSRHVGHRDLQSTYYYIHSSERLRDVIAKYDVTGAWAMPEADYE